MVRSNGDQAHPGHPLGPNQKASPDHRSGGPRGPTAQSTNRPTKSQKYQCRGFQIPDGRPDGAQSKWSITTMVAQGSTCRSLGQIYDQVAHKVPPSQSTESVFCRPGLEKPILLHWICIGLSPLCMEYY